MPDSPQKFYLTTPIYYVNARPHIGHAYTTIVADVLARRARSQGRDTWFLTGTDEHGQKIERSAAAAGIPPQAFTDEVSQSFRTLWDRMGLTYDQYIRTTDQAHKRGVQALWQLLEANGHIYLSSYTGQYCVSEEIFVEGPPGTIGPDGRPTETVTEENYFFRLSNFQRPLIDLIESNQLEITPESRRNELLSFLRGNTSGRSEDLGAPSFAALAKGGVSSEARPSSPTPEQNPAIQAATSPSSTPEQKPAIQAATSPSPTPEQNPVILSASSSTYDAESKDPEGAGPSTSAHPFSTAIPHSLTTPPTYPIGPTDLPPHLTEEPTPETPTPTPPGLAYSTLGNPYVPGTLRDLSISRSSFTWGIPVPGNPKHVIYVWLDALANYLTAVGYGDESPEAQAKFVRYWPADLHLVGKEIIRQHCIYWPAFLMAANLPLPKKVVAHGWLLFEESKMSKSRGNIVRTETILEAFGTLCPPPARGAPSSADRLIVGQGEVSSEARPPQHADATLNPIPDHNPPPSDASHKGTSTSAPPNSALLKGTASAVPQEPTPNPALAAEVSSPSDHDRDLFAADVLRYFLLREIPFGQDGSFSFEALITRYNADLANGYGNLVSRTLKMIQDNLSGVIPVSSSIALADSPAEAARFLASGFEAQVVQHVDRCIGMTKNQPLENAFNAFLGEVNLAVTLTDKFISEQTPWKLAKSTEAGAREKLSDILATVAESIRIITALLHPILPYATANVWRQLGLGDIEEADLKNLQWGGLQPGTRLGPLSPIFPRADKGLATIMTDLESQKAPVSRLVDESFTASPQTPQSSTHPAAPPATSTFTEPTPGTHVGASQAITTERTPTPSHTEAAPSGIFTNDQSPQITIDDFAKVELRIAQIIACDRIPKADKLLRLEVDLGYEKRQILSGIAEWYTPEDLIGRRIVVITNLAPRKMRGLESHGMLLAASSEGGKPALATFDAADQLPLGSRLK